MTKARALSLVVALLGSHASRAAAQDTGEASAPSDAAQVAAQPPSTETSSTATASDAAPAEPEVSPKVPSEAEASANTPVEPSSDAAMADASALDLLATVQASEEPSYPQLRFYGFADTTATHFFLPDDSVWGTRLPTNTTFALGNLNLYADSKLSERARSLFEVRFMFLPNGSEVTDATGALVRTDTQAQDYTIFGQPTRWGGISIERAYLSYDFHPLLQVAVGRLITPWGVWNVDHGTPTLIGIVTPIANFNQFIPRAQTGIQLSGTWSAGSSRAGYFLTLSNGRGPIEAYRDLDGNKALGGRVFFATSSVGDLTVGLTGYMGRMTDPRRHATANADGTDARIVTDSATQFDERALSADLRWEYEGIVAVAEATLVGTHYLEGGRPPTAGIIGALPPPDGRPQLETDTVMLGGYGLLGYRFRFLGIMPYSYVDYAYNSDYALPRTLMLHGGLNVRPEPNIVLKLQYSHVRLVDAKPVLLGEHPVLNAIIGQVAWAF